VHAMFYVWKPEGNSEMDGNKPRLEDNIKNDFKKIE
jgi:hypothetical protein